MLLIILNGILKIFFLYIVFILIQYYISRMPSLPSYIYIGGAPTDILHGHGRVNSDIVVPSNGLKEQIKFKL